MSNFDNIILPLFYFTSSDNANKSNIQEQLVNRKEFYPVEISSSSSSQNIGDSWIELQRCVEELLESDDDFLILCASDHIFSKNYTSQYLIKQILLASKFGSKILLGNFNDFNYAVPVSENLFWVDSFVYSTFIVIYRTMFKDILQQTKGLDADIFSTLSSITSQKMAMFPFIGTRKIDFNSKTIFNATENRLYTHQYVFCRYIKQGSLAF